LAQGELEVSNGENTARLIQGWGQLVTTGYQNRFFPSGDGPYGPSPPLFARILESVVSIPAREPISFW